MKKFWKRKSNIGVTVSVVKKCKLTIHSFGAKGIFSLHEELHFVRKLNVKETA